MLPHHERAIQRLKESYENDPDALALIVGGSVAKGWARPDSDIDFMVVVTEEVYARKLSEERLMVFGTDLTDYEGGYTDGKIVRLPFLRLVAERGSEPARSAFLGAIVLFDRTGEVRPLVDRILTYPEVGVEERIRRFHSQTIVWMWFVGEAAKRDDPYLMSRAVTELALFAMRLILAVNRRIYPYHKWVTRMLEETPDKPEAIVEKIQTMVRTPSVAAAQAVIDSIHAWRPFPVDMGEHCYHFLQDSEWNWIDGHPPIGDC